MKTIKNILLMPLFFFGITSVFSQSVIGKWTTIDDDTNKAKSVVEIYQENDKIFGKVVEIIDKTKEHKLCDLCEGTNKNQPILGMVIMQDLEKDGDTWEGGTILDPDTGKVYKCYIALEGDNKLKVRGYIGFSLLGRTQYWNREIN
ncbi:DUF2147 domain-containing protein [Bizionia arctica]|uniref:DUF2147 domain-containing protein n=1 Tax=Bizionia arctica TaxID=1495645 RepID=A0A917GKM9_9FLAO|nr:DUF2147 domain-containing protein [Bizionia arctica]GGG49403.1 hypothetical protein GCM10010976_20900 [Bizionia arctica]